jgi:hypothetical protein
MIAVHAALLVAVVVSAANPEAETELGRVRGIEETSPNVAVNASASG